MSGSGECLNPIRPIQTWTDPIHVGLRNQAWSKTKHTKPSKPNPCEQHHQRCSSLCMQGGRRWSPSLLVQHNWQLEGGPPMVHPILLEKVPPIFSLPTMHLPLLLPHHPCSPLTTPFSLFSQQSSHASSSLGITLLSTDNPPFLPPPLLLSLPNNHQSLYWQVPRLARAST